MRTPFIRRRCFLWAIVFIGTAAAWCQAPERVAVAPQENVTLNEIRRSEGCAQEPQRFRLLDHDLAVAHGDGGILFTAGMTIDADGAPNAYAPHNRGLDLTANARGAQGWVALVTNKNGRPVIQKSGPYRGYYVSTTSLEHDNIRDRRNPKRYIDARTVPYIALPPDFARTFGIHLGDLAVVLNQENGRTAYAIFADVGPEGRIGEGSIALAKALGIPANPRHDGVEDGITYLIFSGSAAGAKGHITARNVRISAARLYREWGGRQKLRTCERSLVSREP
jgi:hypothetical protein